MTRETWLASVKQYVSSSAEVKQRNGGYDLSLYCDHCGKRTVALHMNSRCDPQQLSKRLTAIGWRMGNRLACPEHRERKERTMDHVDQGIEKPPLVIDKPSGQERAEASEKAKKAKRECISILEDVFNPVKGCYVPGENDETVGRTVGLSPQAVRLIREEFFGVIKRPPELDELFSQIEALATSLDEWRGNINGEAEGFSAQPANLKARINNVANRYG
jgi:hypothetical protein